MDRGDGVFIRCRNLPGEFASPHRATFAGIVLMAVAVFCPHDGQQFSQSVRGIIDVARFLVSIVT